VSQLVLIPEGNPDLRLAQCLEHCRTADLQVAMMPPLSELFLKPSHVAQVGGVPLLPLGQLFRDAAPSPQPGKRVADIVVSAMLLLLFAPLFAVVAAAVKLTDGGPVLYRQRRVGFNGKVFDILKFRSMRVGAERLVLDLTDRNATDGLLFKVVDDPRVTTAGRVIRRLSIDELPQLWNVLRGQMSLVGPRPLAVEPEHFGPLDFTRHRVLPGITGYWQITGGNGLTYEEMVKLDLAYIQNWSLWLDLRLLVRTLPVLLHRRDPW
jgi:exopolysaccharide biosynthesis polyprenyl glycosylphosphotransferase